MRAVPLALLLAATLIVGLSTPLFAEEPPANSFPAERKIGGKAVKLNGYGLLEWGVFEVDLYWAALYLETKTRDAKTAIADKGAKRLKMVFCRSLTLAQMREAYSASFKVNAGDQLWRYKKRVATLLLMMSAVDEGDKLYADYVPGKGLTLWIKGKNKGTIKGADFARMFFKLYLGSDPPSGQLKRGLLGGKGY